MKMIRTGQSDTETRLHVAVQVAIKLQEKFDKLEEIYKSLVDFTNNEGNGPIQCIECQLWQNNF